MCCIVRARKNLLGDNMFLDSCQLPGVETAVSLPKVNTACNLEFVARLRETSQAGGQKTLGVETELLSWRDAHPHLQAISMGDFAQLFIDVSECGFSLVTGRFLRRLSVSEPS